MKQEIDRLLSQNSLLKAKDIAKALGKTRKQVNSFLYAHTDSYKKNDKHEWQVIRGPACELVLPGKWLTGDDFESALHDAGPVLNGPDQEVCVVFSEGTNTMIDCTARLLSLANQLVQKGKRVTLDFEDAGGTRTYLNRAGFFDLLHANVDVLPERPTQSAAKRHHGKSDTLVEFDSVDPHSDNLDLIAQLTKKFVQQSSEDYGIAAHTVFAELIGNVSEHSQSPLPGFAGLQKYKGRRSHIQTVVSDGGLGIARTLRPALKAHYPELYEQYGHRSLESDMGLVAAAMSEVRASRFGGSRGLGFQSSREQAIKFDAQFSVRQERFCLKFIFRNGVLVEVQPKTELRSLPGTHICFDFYLD